MENLKKYVYQTLKEEKLWKIGESDIFEVMIQNNKWIFTLRKEEEDYKPYKYSLTGKKVGTNETWSRRYLSMESAFLHILNNLNENTKIKNKYDSIEDWFWK